MTILKNSRFGNITRTDEAAKLAKANGIKLKDIRKGTGQQGKILVRDVQRYITKLKKNVLYENMTPKALDFVMQENVNPKDVNGTGKEGKITKTDVRKYLARKEKWNIKNFFLKTGLRTSVVLVLGYFLKVGTFPFTKHGSIDKKALRELCENKEYPKISKAACKLLEALKLGLNPKFLTILEKNPRATEHQLYKLFKFVA